MENEWEWLENEYYIIFNIFAIYTGCQSSSGESLKHVPIFWDALYRIKRKKQTTILLPFLFVTIKKGCFSLIVEIKIDWKAVEIIGVSLSLATPCIYIYTYLHITSLTIYNICSKLLKKEINVIGTIQESSIIII